MSSRKLRQVNILKGLKRVGKTAKNVAVPAIAKGVSVVYNTMARGIEIGAKGATLLAKQSRRNLRRSRKGRKTHRKSHRRH